MDLAKWIIAVFVLLPATSHAKDDWTNADTAWQAVYTALHVADWGQTLDIVDSCETRVVGPYSWDVCEFGEGNPILGQRPTRGEVNTYFATTLLLHTAIAYYLPPKYRRAWQVVWIGLEAGTVAHNARAGVNISF